MHLLLLFFGYQVGGSHALIADTVLQVSQRAWQELGIHSSRPQAMAVMHLFSPQQQLMVRRGSYLAEWPAKLARYGSEMSQIALGHLPGRAGEC